MHAKSGEAIGKQLECGNPVYAVALSHNGRVVATGDCEGFVRLWRGSTGELACKPLSYGEEITTLALSGDGHVVAAGSYGSKIRLWHGETGEPIGKPIECEYIKPTIALSKGGEMLAVGGSIESMVRIWRTETCEPIGKPLDCGRFDSLAFSPDGRALLIARGQWVLLTQWDSQGLTPVAGRLCSRYWPCRGGWRFVDQSGEHIEMVDGFEDDKPRLVTVRFDRFDVSPIQGDPHQLLSYWEKRLALMIDENGQIVPVAASNSKGGTGL
jgi:WD40 repeat protein